MIPGEYFIQNGEIELAVSSGGILFGGLVMTTFRGELSVASLEP